MLTVHHIFPKKLIGYKLLNIENYDILLSESLIDKFFDFLQTDLIFNESNIDNIIDKINLFCEKNNIKMFYTESNILHAKIINNNIYIYYPKNTKNKDLIYLILHEISHYITNKSSNKKLLKFIKDPNNSNINILDSKMLNKELEYILSPGELSNWAFTLSLHIFESKFKSTSELYKLIKEDLIKNKWPNKFYYSLNNGIKSLYNIQLYIYQLKQLKDLKRKSHQYRFMSLIKLIDKYVKRLNKLFK
jgi:hypothetical protein